MSELSTHAHFRWDPLIMKHSGFFGSSEANHRFRLAHRSMPRAAGDQAAMASQRVATHQFANEPQRVPLRIDISCPDTNSVLVTPIGEADISTARKLGLALSDALLASRSQVTVNLDHLTFMDASTLGVLVTARARAAAAGRTLQVRCRPGRNRRLFKITGLEALLERREPDPVARTPDL